MANQNKSRTKKKRKPVKKTPSTAFIVVALVVALVLELCNLNFLGQVGGYLQYVQFGLFGIMAYLFPVAGFLFILYLNYRKKEDKKAIICMVIIFICLCILAHLISGLPAQGESLADAWTKGARDFTGGGIIGGMFAIILKAAVSRAGAWIVTILAIIICIALAVEYPFAEKISGFIKERRENRRYYDYDDYDDYDDYEYEEITRKNAKKTSSSRGGGPYEDERQIKTTNRRIREDGPTRRSGSFRDSFEHRYPSDEHVNIENNKRAQVYEGADKDGNYIKIAYVPSKKKQQPAPRADLNRVNKKAKTVRDASAPGQLIRSANKTKGLGEGIELYPLDANGDEIHEITRLDARNKKQENKEIKTAAGQTGAAGNEPDVAFSEDKVVASEKASNNTISSSASAASNAAGTGRSSANENASTKRSGMDAAEKAVPKKIEKIKPAKTSKDGYKFPPLDLLEKRSKNAGGGNDDLNQVAQNLELILSTYGVSAKVIDAQEGPSVTRYELQPELGTRVSRITSLADDLKLNLAVPDIRIEAPIPGRAAIGIEIPNKTKQVVLMRDLLEEHSLISHPSKIAYAAGKDISGNVIVSDIAKMPHLLVAGTTGSGKSTFVNTILMTILYRAKPSEVGLIIIDPKKIEFGVYSGIPHLVQDVVTDPAQAVSTLRWAVVEMTNRYQRMQLSGVRDFKSYNTKFDNGQLNPEEENPKRMSQIVIVIDELADLMMVASKEAESLICRLAQLARAAGIHLIIATQRPSVDVVTGLIKANIPARVALLVASGTDSRTIIDANGAEKLLGNGDMLFYPTGYVKPVRVQGAYVSEKEVHDTIEFIKTNNESGYYAEEAMELETFMNGEADVGSAIPGPKNDDSSGAGKLDEFFYEAGKLCIETGKASSSMLQRRFSIGFNRAAKIIDQLEEIGAVGPQNGAKPREILVDALSFDELYNNAIG